jgi:glucans biosynthesis protein C
MNCMSLIGDTMASIPELESKQRFHSLDGLRAAMMLLGLVIHSIITYGVADYGDAWPLKDAHTNVLCDILLFYIHIFRMPIFFIMAGFFAALLYERRKPLGMARNRVARIGLPLVVAWYILWYPMATFFVFSIQAKTSSVMQALKTAYQFAFSTPFPHINSTAHLWFLYYLILFYLTFLILIPIVRHFPNTMRNRAMVLFRKIATSRLRPLWFALPTAFLLLTTKDGTYPAPASWIPSWDGYLPYILFFSFGWLLYETRDVLSSFRSFAWTNAILGIAGLFLCIMALGPSGVKNPHSASILSIGSAIVSWLCAFGFTGLFLRYLDRPSPVVRYLVDASYWSYLIHIPFTFLLPGFLVSRPWPALIKASIVLSGTGLICLASYELLVRSTWIGKALNGRRYPHGLPVIAASGEKGDDSPLASGNASFGATEVNPTH